MNVNFLLKNLQILANDSDQQGNDTLVGGVGDDEYDLYPQKGSSTSGSSTIIENEDEGHDTIYISDAYNVDMVRSADGNDLVISAFLNGTLVGTNIVKDQYTYSVPLVEEYDLWLDGSDQYWNFTKGNIGNFDRNLIVGTSGDDTLEGGSDDDLLFGGAGNDNLNGGNGNDDLRGGSGDDIITGGAGSDTLTGGNGNDTFKFSAGDSIFYGINNASNIIDTITDLSIGDKIDLSAISANLNLITSVIDINSELTVDTTTSGFDVFFAKLNDHYYLAYETTSGDDNAQGNIGVIDIGITMVGSLSTYTVSDGIITIR